MERQPDIEVYVRGCPTERLVAWLESVVGPLEPAEAAGAATVYPSRIGPIGTFQNTTTISVVGIGFSLP